MRCLTLLPEQPLVKIVRIQTLRYRISHAFPLPRIYFKATMDRWFQRKRLRSQRLRAILTFTGHPSFIGSLRKYTRACLIPMRNADLEGVVVESRN